MVASKDFTVHSRRPHSRQDQAQDISNDCQSNHEKYELDQSPKYFEIRRQPQNIKNFGGGSIDCLKITEDKSSNNRVHTSDARMIKAIDTVLRRGVRSLCLVKACVSNITVVPRCKLEARVATS